VVAAVCWIGEAAQSASVTAVHCAALLTEEAKANMVHRRSEPAVPLAELRILRDRSR
jgi:hypothetical protein